MRFDTFQSEYATEICDYFWSHQLTSRPAAAPPSTSHTWRSFLEFHVLFTKDPPTPDTPKCSPPVLQLDCQALG